MSLTRFHQLTFGLILFSFFVMTLGPLVRAEDAGLACPDWPLCFGHVVPPYEYRVYLEFIHRVVAGILGIGFLLWAGFLIAVTELRKRFLLWAILAMVLLASQIWLGGETITRKLSPYIVKSHLINALLYVSVLIVIWKKSAPNRPENSASRKALWLTGGFAFLVLFQIYMGGRVSTNEAGLACTDFPSCYKLQSFAPDGSSEWNSVFFPKMQGHVEMHISHRLVAYVLTLFAFVLYGFGLRAGLTTRQQQRLFVIILMILTQILLGALNVLYQIPVPITVAHSLVANLIYLFSFENWLEGHAT
ncbi:MAG: COX15/CtaA family protein [Leptospirales bacterium]|nr:COX15/CtaA family protein [Leptospirales bacterium]